MKIDFVTNMCALILDLAIVFVFLGFMLQYFIQPDSILFKIFETNQVKYVWINFDEHLTFKTHFTTQCKTQKGQ